MCWAGRDYDTTVTGAHSGEWGNYQQYVNKETSTKKTKAGRNKYRNIKIESIATGSGHRPKP